jgi:tripartite-type tricarboxylate transporter receptor subunit TctC
VAGFVAWARAHGGPVGYAIPSAGSVAHFAGVSMGRVLGLPMADVPYRGSGPILADVMGGQMPAAVLPLGGVPALHRDGNLRILGVTAGRPPHARPDVRTFADQGWPALVVTGRFGLLLPAATPPGIVAALHQAVLVAATTPEVREGIARVDYAAITEAPETLARRIVGERGSLGRLVRSANIHVEG